MELKSDPQNCWGSGPPSTNELASNAQPLQNSLIAFGIRIAQVRQKPTALRDQSKQSLAGTVVLAMRFEVLRQHRDALTQQGNLHFWRPSVGFVALI
jgi:hypothetical protein